MIGVFRGSGADRDHQLVSLQVLFEALSRIHHVPIVTMLSRSMKAFCYLLLKQYNRFAGEDKAGRQSFFGDAKRSVRQDSFLN
jgi:hypothetical protein